jgi:hypothetical protein
MSQKTPKYLLTYPEATDHTRTWEHWQTLAGDVETALTKYTVWQYVAATAAVNLPANVDYGVGSLTIVNGGSVLTGGLDGFTNKVPGILIWSALYYIPSDSTRQGWGNPPGESKLFLENWYSGGADRNSVSGVFNFTAAGQLASFGWRSSQAVNGNTFTLRGVFLPVQPA